MRGYHGVFYVYLPGAVGGSHHHPVAGRQYAGTVFAGADPCAGRHLLYGAYAVSAVSSVSGDDSGHAGKQSEREGRRRHLRSAGADRVDGLPCRNGNLVGVVAAISAGGAGAVFWMWIIALLGHPQLYRSDAGTAIQEKDRCMAAIGEDLPTICIIFLSERAVGKSVRSSPVCSLCPD
ncbi:MAG: alanine:cation symporter family protein [Merdibacter sp.]